MKHDTIDSGKRKSVNLSLDTGIVTAAREAGLNLSKVSEAALREATQAERGRRWQEDNREALDGWGRWVEKHGLPLAKHRLF